MGVWHHHCESFNDTLNNDDLDDVGKLKALAVVVAKSGIDDLEQYEDELLEAAHSDDPEMEGDHVLYNIYTTADIERIWLGI